MSVALRHPMTVAEFLAWEERQEFRWEFDGFEPVAMTGGTVAHQVIGDNILVALQNRLAGRHCRAFGANLKIDVAGRIRYPDAFVSCTPVPPKSTVIRDPVVVFEVLSEGTSRTDRIAKLREYGATPSIQRYVILEQDAIAAMVFVRKGTDLVAATLTADDTLRMPEIDVEVPMAEFYTGIEIIEEQAAESA
ncbi:Uma2 family endonuclease [Acidisphaera sp. S103]|uniref:Uma2 family endonuclease n=1 Tax=Acidisphaera sp. S103 TaxID=1747223 RepID=UPI00131AE7AE|nr:Uma2 family endonuclease [Acidisphaera sp. S103]